MRRSFSPSFVSLLAFCFYTNKSFPTNLTSRSSSFEKLSSISSLRDETHKIQSNCSSDIRHSIMSSCSYICDKKGETFVESSLQNLLNMLLDWSPGTIRRFWRVSALKPEDVLEILLAVDFDHRKTEKVKILWQLFNWAACQRKEFGHLPQASAIMVSLLTRGGLLAEADCLLQKMESQGILLGSGEIYCEIITRYVAACELENSMVVYNRARYQGLALSESSYQLLLHLSIKMNKPQLALRLFTDMLVAGYGSSARMQAFEFVVGVLCKDRNIQEARNLLTKMKGFGVGPSHAIINNIAAFYCSKGDFDDLLNFLIEWKFAPDAKLCNKIISSQCRTLGTEFSWLFMQKLENIGFIPDEITFGILICWSCKEGKLKNAFIYLSVLLSQCLKPDVHAYNALISAIFKEGMGKHAKDVFYDMLGRGISPNLSTFRVLLAGYCRDRKFDEVKAIIGEMVKCGTVSLSPLEGMLSKAFVVLGLDPLHIKVKRDNDVGHPKAEFFDNLGNGLYLETDIDEFETTILGILDDSLIPDFNAIVTNACHDGDTETAIRAKSEMVRWGQDLSLSAYAEVLKRICGSLSHVKAAINLLEEKMEWSNQLEPKTLNLLIQFITKKGIIYKGRQILDGMLQKHMPVESKTYTTLITGFCREGNMKGLQECWDLAQKNQWLPEPEDCKTLVSCLCKGAMLDKALDLFEKLLGSYSCLVAYICDIFLKELCIMGFTSIGCVLVEKVQRMGLSLDYINYNHLIRGFCKEKNFDEALRILDIVLEKSMIPCIKECKLLIPWLCSSNRLEKAITLKESMLREQLQDSVFIYNALLNGLCKIGKVNEAALQLHEMMTKGVLLDNNTFNIMLCGHCQENNVGIVWNLLGVMLRRNFCISVSGYRQLVHMMCRQGRVNSALSLKEVMLRDGEYPYLVMYNILIFYLFQAGSSLLVMDLLDEMHEKGLILDQGTYNFLIFGYYKCKDIPKSVDMLNSMLMKNMRPSNRSFNIVIGYLCSHGGLNKALELSKMMEFRGWIHSSVAQTTLVASLLSYGRFQEAEIFLDRMEEKGLIPDKIDYDVLINWFSKHRRMKKAVDLLNVMLKKGEIPSGVTYDAIIHGFCSQKDIDKALDFHIEMLHKKLVPSIRTCSVLIRGLCEHGRVGEAERLLDIILQSGQAPTRNMYQSVIERYCLESNLCRASHVTHKMQQNGHLPDFETHWSLISNLNNADGEDNGKRKGFLSKLLSRSGFPTKDNGKSGKPAP